jgi:hypothetical protein
VLTLARSLARRRQAKRRDAAPMAASSVQSCSFLSAISCKAGLPGLSGVAESARGGREVPELSKGVEPRDATEWPAARAAHAAVRLLTTRPRSRSTPLPSSSQSRRPPVSRVRYQHASVGGRGWMNSA